MFFFKAKEAPSLLMCKGIGVGATNAVRRLRN
jgi:hypothetical protein